jgi:hypothetical protein
LHQDIQHVPVMRAATFPERVRYGMGSRLDPYLPYLHKRWTEGIHNPLQLWRDIRARGYPGAARMRERYVLRLSHRLRGLTPQQSAKFLRGALPFPLPSIRRVTAWVQRSARALTTKQRHFLLHLERVSPEVKETRVLVRGFRHLLNHRQVSQFPRCLT